jgi:hypothetical protein
MRWRVTLFVALVVALSALVVPSLTSASATGTRVNSSRVVPSTHSEALPNFNGTWINSFGNAAFTVTSGTSTSIVGHILYPPQCHGSSGTVKGTIVNGSGQLTLFQKSSTNDCLIGLFPEYTVTSVKVIGGLATLITTTAGTFRNFKTGLYVTLASTVPSTGFAVGSTVTVTGTVTAIGTAFNDITLGNGLTTSSSAVTLGAPPTGFSGFSLTPEASRVISFTVSGAQNGSATLTLAATGQSSSGTSFQDSATLDMKVGVLTFDYTMPERYSESALTTQYAQPKNYTVVFTVDQGHCLDDAKYSWFADGNPLTTQSNQPCMYQADFDKLGTYSVRVEEQVKGSSSPSDAYTQKVVVQDLLIVSLGDSLASGEGSPPYSGPYDCDRSKLAYGAQAAKHLEGADLRSSVTFLQLSCSGADIRPIALGSGFFDKLGRAADFDKAEDTNIFSQLADLKVLVGDRPIDALTLSIGINNVNIQVAGFKIGFAKLVAICVADKRCQDQCVSGSDCSGLHKFIPPDLGGSQTPQTIADLMPDAIDQLSDLYDKLGEAINKLFPESQLKPTDVYVVGYPDPLHDETGTLCPVLIPRGGDGTNGGFENSNGEDETTWFESAFIKPLQRAEGRAASHFHWNYVDPDYTFLTHGYCSTSNWFVHLGDLTSGKMNASGIFHPTSVGQAVLADTLYDQMSQQLLPDGHARKPA